MILLYGDPDDPPLLAVARELAACGAEHYFFHDFQRLAVSVAGDVTGRFTCNSEDHALEKVTGVYLRPPRRFQSSLATEEPGDGVRSMTAAFHAWTEVTTARVANRYSTMATNTSKPYQLRLIAQAGFLVPPTIVTTSPDEVLRFWERHGEIVYKSASGIRSRVERFGINHLARLSAVTACPTQFQRWIEGVDVRVHVIGRKTFATEVAGETDDYRYPRGGPPPQMRAITLPPYVAARCIELAASMQLIVAGVDLRVDRQGCWYCFEINPSPAFTYYADETGQPVAVAVARFLAGAS